MSGVTRKPTFWFPTWPDTNQAVQLQKMASGLKFRIKKVVGLPYLCSENKGADQLRGYREADLRLCFRNCQKPVFSRRGSNMFNEFINAISSYIYDFKTHIVFKVNVVFGCAD